MGDTHVYLDVSDLEPPEPMKVVLAALTSLKTGQYIHMHHWREPLLLYQRLRAVGCSWQTITARNDQWEIFIWRLDDEVAASQAARAMEIYAPGLTNEPG